MTFSLDTWQAVINQKLQQSRHWMARLKNQQAPYAVYGFLSTMALWPLLDALGAGQVFPVMNALGTVAGNVGGNLIANRLEAWKNQASQENELETLVQQDLADNADLRAAVNTLLDKLAVIPQAYTGLSDADKQWFSAALQQELTALDGLKQLEASLSGAGIVIQDSHLQTGDRGVAGGYVQGHIITGDHNRVAETIIEQQTIIQGPSGSDPAALREAYLHRLMQQARRLPLAGVDPKATGSAAESQEVQLAAVYTALLTQRPDVKRQIELNPRQTFPQRIEAAIHDVRRLSALAALNNEPRLVLLGDPGSGKSTFINFVTLCMTGQALDDPGANLAALTAPLPVEDEREKDKKPQPQPWQHDFLLPVQIVLRDLVARGLPEPGERVDGGTLWAFIKAELGETLQEYAPHLKKTLQEKGGLILLDGLDEVPDANLRRVQVKQTVQGFAADFPRCRFLVTSRTYAYQHQDWKLEGFAEVVLSPFTPAQIAHFVERWYTHIGLVRGLKAEDAQGQAVLLKTAIQRSERLAELAARPLLLTLMASLHAWRGGSLPEKREELYADAVELLLDQWESHKARRRLDGTYELVQPSLAEWLKVDKQVVRAELNWLAFVAHRDQPQLVGTADVPQERLVSALLKVSRRSKPINPLQLEDYLCDRAGLLAARGEGVYTFPHRTFQEYLAACHLTDDDFPYQVADLLRADPQRWREAALLAGAKAARGSASAAWNLADALCYHESPAEDCAQVDGGDCWGALLAAQVLLENEGERLRQVSERNTPKRERMRRWLRAIVERGWLPPVDRALAGEVLAVFGDDRDFDELVTIPAGAFLMGSSEADKQASGDEKPQHKLTLLEYQMGKYQVTNTQFARFIEAGGYKDKRWWTETGWQMRQKNDWAEPRWWRNGRFNQANQPVVTASWYECLAYCRWLTKVWQAEGKIAANEEVCLPTEAEWEKAARGTDGRIYPWGNEWNPIKCNIGELGLGYPCAVGMFPDGVSPYGCLDMAGNVFEWTMSLWGTAFGEPEFKYPYNLTDGRENLEAGDNDLRVLRGGAFGSSQDDARCASRLGYRPYYGGNSVGFRIVVSLISPASAL